MKRVLILCAAILITMVAVTGSIAYFTDEVNAAGNVIVSGNLDIQQNEYERKLSGGAYTDKLQQYTQEQQVYPCVKVDENTAPVVVDGHTVNLPTGMRNYVDKIVNVKNTGNLQAYVRTIIATPDRYQGDTTGIDWLHLVKNNDTNWVWQHNVAKVNIDGTAYALHVATYKNVVAPGAATSPSLLGYYLDSRVSNSGSHLVFVDDNKVKHDLGTDAVLPILVATQATQANPEVFADVNEAMDATFNAISDTNHPWMDAQLVSSQADLNSAIASAAYDTVIALKDGEYTLPESLPKGIRLMGWGTNVNIKGDKVNAEDVEFDHVTFTEKLNFSGFGSFQNVTFNAGVTAAITPEASTVAHQLLFINCFMDEAVVTQNGNRAVFDNCLKLNGLQLQPVVDGQ